MPLSESEKRLLSALEQSLSAADPRLASALVSGRAPRRYWLLAVLGVPIGIVLLLSGVYAGTGFGVLVAVAGYGLVVASVSIVVRALWRRQLPQRNRP